MTARDWAWRACGRLARLEKVQEPVKNGKCRMNLAKRECEWKRTKGFPDSSGRLIAFTPVSLAVERPL